MKYILSIIVFSLSISCKKQTDKKENIKIKDENIDFFEPADLGAFGSDTKLIIYANFDECGEWGGHKESFEIFSKKDKEFYAKYIRSKVDCEKISKLYGKPEFHQPYINKVIKLSQKEKIAINDYLFSLIKSKSKERFPGHAGQNFGVIKTDSTLMIDVYDFDKQNLKNYNKLLKEFKLEKIEYQDR